MRRLIVPLVLLITFSTASAQQIKPNPLDLIPSGSTAPVQTTHQPDPPVTMLVGSADSFTTPDTVIVGPTGPVQFGKLISLSVKPISSRPAGLYSVTYVWRLKPTPDDLINIGQSQSIFGAGVVDLTVNAELIASYLFLQKDGQGNTTVAQRVVVVEQDIIIGKGSPNNNSNPVNPVNPNPPAPLVIPDTPLGLTKISYEWCRSVGMTDQSAKKRDAVNLCRSFRSVASIVAANVDYNAPNGTTYKLDSPDKILAATKNGNNAAIPQTIEQWKPWFVSLDAKLKELKAAGKLTTTADYVAVWNELAGGLEAASK